jgi:tetratricopeptide (TPR) repeat protein
VSVWDRVRDWLGGGPEVAPEVASFSDARLSKLWKDRAELTDLAREAVRAECVRRGLRLKGLAPNASQSANDAQLPVPTGSVVDVRPGLGVLLQTTPARFALVLLPRWSPAPTAVTAELPVDALIVCNHEPRGFLDASRCASVLGVARENVYATAAGAIDRAPEARGGEAKPLPAKLTLGNLTVSRMPTLSNVLRATWRAAEATAAIGPMLPASLVEAQPASRAYVGSLPAPAGSPAWSALIAGAHASSITAAAGIGPPMKMPSMILVGDAVGVPLARHTHLAPGFGISVIGTECPVAPDAVALLGDVLTGRWSELTLPASAELEEVVEHLVVEARLTDARRLIALGLAARPADPRVLRLDATVHALAGENAEALAALDRAEADSFSLVVRSAVHAALRDFAAAETAARRALAIEPRDPHAMAALVRCLWLAGRGDDARAVIDEAPPFSLTGTRANDLYESIASEPTGDASIAVIPHVAARALAVARRAQTKEQAETAYRRALELDPQCAAAREVLARYAG